MHHEHRQPYALTAGHFHPIDYILQVALPFAATLTIVDSLRIGGCRVHLLTHLVAGVYFSSFAVDDHCGFAVPWDPYRIIPGAPPNQSHDYHHSRNVGTYGAKLQLFDTLAGTDVAFYRFMAQTQGVDAEGLPLPPSTRGVRHRADEPEGSEGEATKDR